MSVVGPGSRQPDPEHALQPTGNLRRRLLVSNLLQVATMLAAALAVAVLVILVGFTVVHGIDAMSWSFLTGNLAPATGTSVGGIGPAILGTLELTLIAALFAVTIGVLAAVFVSEFASPRLAAPVRLAIDLMAGLPAIVTGIFIYEIWTVHIGPSILAGAFANTIVMLPLVTRGTIESLQRIPQTWRDAADALGIARWRTVVGLVIPGAASSIVTAVLLAIALGAGEAATILINNSVGFGLGVQLNPFHAAPSLPLTILQDLELGFTDSKETAWGAAFLLMAVILIVNIAARVLLRRGERKRGL
jgi:phosphate transport system permease protein